jgi:hypothetical protein
VAALDFPGGQHAIAVRVDSGKRFRQESASRFRDGKPAVLVRIELFEQPRRRGLGIDLQSAARVRVPAHPSLCLRPAQHGQRPGRPAAAAGRARIDLLLQIEQDDVAERF